MADSEQSYPASSRAWRVIAHELTHETNPKRILELSEELSRVFDEQMRDLPSPLANAGSQPYTSQKKT